MNPVYTRTQLESKKLIDLKAIALQRSVTPSGDKRIATNWVEAILNAQPQSIERPATLKPLVEMNGDECVVGGEIVATITSDDDLTQPWVVKINGVEIHRRGTWALAYDYVRTHAKYGTLPSPQADEVVDDYLFHDEPQLTSVGDSHFIGSNLLRCIEVRTEYVTVWDVIKDGVTVGEISMDWDCFWTHTLSFESFATPQEAVASLCESAAELVKKCEMRFAEVSSDCVSRESDHGEDSSDCISPELEVFPTERESVFTVTNRKSGKNYQVYLESNYCTCPHWFNRHGQVGFRDKHIDAVRQHVAYFPTPLDARSLKSWAVVDTTMPVAH